jgi:hypothetical protein
MSYVLTPLVRLRIRHRQVRASCSSRVAFTVHIQEHFVGGDMIGLVAFDLVLGIIFRSVMHMTLVVKLSSVGWR